MHRICVLAVLSALGAVAIPGCGGDDDGTTTSPTTTEAAVETGCTTGQAGPLEIVLVNDDGVVNPAIDVLIDRLAQDGDIELDVTVVAPADERSGTADRSTPGGATYTQAATPGGNPAYAVDGFPADAVLVALDDLGLEPHLVVSGINPGHNFGPFATISGTVGAARTAIRRGVPALAVSAGLTFDEEQFAVGADLAAGWIEDNCQALIDRSFPTETLASINIPACAPEEMGPLREVPRAEEMPQLPEGEDVFSSTCDLADPEPADDVTAVRSGYPALTQIEADI